MLVNGLANNCQTNGKKMTLCSTCFPTRDWALDSDLQPILSSGQVFWIGYVVCDPKELTSAPKSSKYDLYHHEILRMNFENVKLVFNHQKHRSALGQIRLAWHDHSFPHSHFAVAVLAVIENRALLETAACVALMGDSFASLSTLEEDASCVVEVSVTYVGARDGCVGVFVPKDRVKEMLARYGLAHEYKCQLPTVRASIMEEQARAESQGIETILQELPESQYSVISDHLKMEQEKVKDLLDKMEDHKRRSSDLGEAVGLLSDYLCSMIQSRIALEQGSSSEVAAKRRRDFDMMKEKGIFDGGFSDMETIRQIVEYCRECFPDSSKAESQIVERFCNMFDERFPELSKRLTKKEPSIATVDAAFDLIRQEMRNKEVSGLSKERQGINNRMRAFEAAKEQYNVLSKDTNTKTNSKDKKTKMDPTFEQFLRQSGIYSHQKDGEDGPPPAKRARSEEDDEFIRYAVSKENEYRNLQKRYKSYEREFKEHKQKREETHREKLRELFDALPAIKEMTTHFRSSGVQEPKSSTTTPTPTPVETEQRTPPQKRTVDASKMETEKILFDL